ncbi:MAG: hypothetical protein ACFFDN_35095, partial [Candidatus Hodarchaeota archaeon]
MGIRKKIYNKLTVKSFFLLIFMNWLRLPIKRNFIRIIRYIKKVISNYPLKKKYKERNRFILSSLKIYPKIGFVLKLNPHLGDEWVVILFSYAIYTINWQFSFIIAFFSGIFGGFLIP